MKQGKLPILSGIEVVKVLGKIGYVVNDQKGSHIHLRHLSRRPVTVPNHPVIARGTLRMIMNQVEIILEDFWKLFNLKDISNFGHKMDTLSIMENSRPDRSLQQQDRGWAGLKKVFRLFPEQIITQDVIV